MFELRLETGEILQIFGGNSLWTTDLSSLTGWIGFLRPSTLLSFKIGRDLLGVWQLFSNTTTKQPSGSCLNLKKYIFWFLLEISSLPSELVLFSVPDLSSVEF